MDFTRGLNVFGKQNNPESAVFPCQYAVSQCFFTLEIFNLPNISVICTHIAIKNKTKTMPQLSKSVEKKHLNKLDTALIDQKYKQWQEPNQN